jgi:hypothetical protein
MVTIGDKALKILRKLKVLLIAKVTMSDIKSLLANE